MRAAMVDGAFGAAGARVRARRMPGRRRALVLRDRGRRAVRGVRIGAGPQAAARRRSRAQHRRDGGVCAERAHDRRRCARASNARSSTPVLRGHGRRGHAVCRLPLLRADAHRRRAEGDRVQLPLRRSRGPGGPAAARRAAGAAAAARPAPASRLPATRRVFRATSPSGVVLASRGYPGQPDTGHVIRRPRSRRAPSHPGVAVAFCGRGRARRRAGHGAAAAC